MADKQPRMYIEEMDGVRSIVVTDGGTLWWSMPFTEEREWKGVGLYDRSLEETARVLRESIDAERECLAIMADDEWYNPAWDKHESIERAHEHEIEVLGEEVPHGWAEVTA